MTDTRDRLAELKIDRGAAAPDGRRWLWPAAALVAVLAAGATWFLVGTADGATLVETETARRAPSAAAAGSVLDASGYVTARREATVSSEITGKVAEVRVEEGMRVEKGQVVAL
ncbi:MAG: biotin/lipoyl-binding protein, partial [Woeseia sp.]